MDIAFSWGQAALATASQVIVVRADHNRFILQFGIAAGQNADYVE